MRTRARGQIVLCALSVLCGSPLRAAEPTVQITPQIKQVPVEHEGKLRQIRRAQDPTGQIAPNFQRTSRKCPPFCVQPMYLPGGVETIAELEMLDYLQRVSAGDDSVLVIDSRTPRWLRRGTIPGSINLPYKRLSLRSTASSEIAQIMENQFGARRTAGGLWDFSAVKTLILFCNGAWCGQSPINIRSLVRFGYPAAKIKWYRGGMQAWETLGLTTVTTGTN